MMTSIVEHGAVEGGERLCTGAFEKAVGAASAAGGQVVVPAGKWVTGPIVLKSNVELHLERGAVVMFSRKYAAYPLVATDYEGEEAVRCMSPVWGVDLVNVAITGEGVIDGQGEAWRPVKKWKMTGEQWEKLLASGGKVVRNEEEIWWPTEKAAGGAEVVRQLKARGAKVQEYEAARDYLRPNMVKLTRCRNVRLEGVTFTNSAAWNVHLLMCENVELRDVKILNPWWSSNGDALDLDSCRNVVVRDSHFDAGDDAICIKSGKDEAGRKRGRACENIAVENCTVVHGHGGVTIGSEMSGGVRNVRVSNCVFGRTDIGIRFKTTRGRGGVVENIDISNIEMRDITHHAISISMYYWIKGEPVPEPVSERTPRIRAVEMRNITCRGAKHALEIRGLPEMPVKDVVLRNVSIEAEEGAVLCDAEDVTLDGVELDVKSGPAVQCHSVRGLKMERVAAKSPMPKIEGRVGDL